MEILNPAEPPPAFALVGPAKEFLIQAAMDDELGQERTLAMELAVLVDFDAAVLPYLRGFDPVTEGVRASSFSWTEMRTFFPHPSPCYELFKDG